MKLLTIAKKKKTFRKIYRVGTTAVHWKEMPEITQLSQKPRYSKKTSLKTKSSLTLKKTKTKPHHTKIHLYQKHKHTHTHPYISLYPDLFLQQQEN